MAAPVAVQKLKHGKALCGKTFGQFVETFNWLVDFCLSMQGDRDANPGGDGRIVLDRADPSAPVIRLAAANGNGGGGGGSDEPDEPLEPGADPDEPYEDPEDDFSGDEEAIDADGNDISNDAGSLDGGGGDYCNSIGGGAPSESAPGNEISNTCSK